MSHFTEKVFTPAVSVRQHDRTDTDHAGPVVDKYGKLRQMQRMRHIRDPALIDLILMGVKADLHRVLCHLSIDHESSLPARYTG